MMKINKIWFEGDWLYGLGDDGKTYRQSLLWYKRLMEASPDERAEFEISTIGIHWPRLDEDVSFESFEYDDPEPTGISLIFLSHPELNAAAVGRRLGISQSLMAQYINGTKKPSKERERMIMDEIANIASELHQICA